LKGEYLLAGVGAPVQAAGISIETDPVRRFVTRERRLEAVELSTGAVVPCAVIFTHPAQRQVDLVPWIGLTLDERGYVRADAAMINVDLAMGAASADVDDNAAPALGASPALPSSPSWSGALSPTRAKPIAAALMCSAP
jgi:hypothetical protein